MDQFVQLVLKHQWRVRAFTATILSSVHDVDDAVQNTFLVAWQKKEEFRYEDADPDEEFVRWVCTIARYKALQGRDSLSSSPILFDEGLVGKLVEFQFEKSAYLEARHRALTTCIARLNDRDRDLIRGRYAEDRAVEEIAEEIGMTTSAIYKTLKRIRGALMHCIDRAMRTEGFDATRSR